MQSTTSRWLAMSSAALVNEPVQIMTTRSFLDTCVTNDHPIFHIPYPSHIARGFVMALEGLVEVRLQRQHIAGLLGGAGKEWLPVGAVEARVAVDLRAEWGHGADEGPGGTGKHV